MTEAGRRFGFDDEKVVSLPLKGGGGGGTSGGMEQKVAVLESDVKEIKADLKVLIKDVAELKGKVSQLPTTLQLLGFVVAIVVAAGLVKHFFP